MRVTLRASGAPLEVQHSIAAQAKQARQQYPNAGALIVDLRDYVACEVAKASVGEVITVNASVSVECNTSEPVESVAEVAALSEDEPVPLFRRARSK